MKKKMISVLLTAVMVMSLVACGNSEKAEAPAEEAVKEEAAESETPEESEEAPVTLVVGNAATGETNPYNMAMNWAQEWLEENNSSITLNLQLQGVMGSETEQAQQVVLGNQDICQIARRRNPYVQLILYPAKVQGEGAAATVVKGIRALEGKVDVIIVGRGGGSIEDLWAFNEEIVAREIYNCSTPIISAVGHETDTTIADYVSDLRAPTPSAAAELAVYDVQLLLEQLADIHGDMANRMVLRMREKRMLLKQKHLLLERFHPRYQLQQKRLRADELAEKLSLRMKEIIRAKRQRVELAAERLAGLSPVARLEGGYSVASKDGCVIKEIAQVSSGDTISIDVTDGTIFAQVQDAKKR